MDVTTEKKEKEFVEVLVKRGLGIYGKEKMAKICYDSGIALLDDDSIDFIDDNIEEAIKKLLINYSKFNLVAKMTAVVLAKRYGIPIPPELQKKKKKKSRLRRLFSRGW